METYKNDYSQKEDSMLWEIHEIRHRLQEKYQNKTAEEINGNALKAFEEWKAQRRKSSDNIFSGALKQNGNFQV